MLNTKGDLHAVFSVSSLESEQVMTLLNQFCSKNQLFWIIKDVGFDSNFLWVTILVCSSHKGIKWCLIQNEWLFWIHSVQIIWTVLNNQSCRFEFVFNFKWRLIQNDSFESVVFKELAEVF